MQAPRGRTTLVRRILAGVLPIVLLSVLAVGVANYLVARRQIDKGIQNEVDSLARQAAMGLEATFARHRRDLQSLVDSPLLVDYANFVEAGLQREMDDVRREIVQHMENFAARNGEYREVLLFDSDQRYLVGVAGGDVVPARRFEDLPWGAAELRGVFESPIQARHAERVIYYGSEFTNSHGVPWGLVVLTCDLEHVAEMLATAKVGDGGAAYLTDASGQPRIGARASARQVMQRSVPIEGTPWQVVVQADAEEFFAPLVRLRDLSIGLLGLVGLMLPLLVAAAVRRSTRPIDELVAGTRRLAAGELDFRVAQPATHELAVLADAFNTMAEKLKRRESELRSRIRQLTALRKMEGAAIQRLTEESILRTCLEAIASGLGFDGTGLYWVDTQQRQLVGRFVHPQSMVGLSEGAFRQRHVPLGGPDILNQVVRRREAVLLRAPWAAQLEQAFLSGAGELVMAPICGKDRVYGVILAANHARGRALQDSDREALALFAAAAGLALDNVELVEQLSASEARQRMVLDNSPVAILGLSEDHQITTWNRGAEAIFGYTAAEMLGRPLAALFPAGSAAALEGLVAAVREHGGVREHAIAGADKKGQALELNVSWGGASPQYAANKEWAVVIRDVTEARKLQRQLIFSEKLSAVGQLIAGIAHELNNPLQAVVGYAELLNVQHVAMGLPSKEVRHIFENAGRCRKIIENLLLFVRQGEVKKAAVGVQEVVKAAMDLLTHKVRKVAKLDIRLELPVEPLHVRANFQQLEQVVVNLVNNACDAMESWPGPRELRVGVRRAGQKVRLELADSGPGMGPAVVERIFEPFYTTKPEGRGTGLGLPVCRQIVEDHGGELGVVTQIGGGTTFWIELPAVEAEPLAAPATSVTVERQGAPAAAEAGPSAARILLVEDEAAVRELLYDVLTSAGHRVEQVASFEAAAARLAASSFGLVVTDINLDDGSGTDLYRRWASLAKGPRPPFVFLTGELVAQPVKRDGGAETYLLQKPVDLRELRQVIATGLACRRAQGAAA